MKRLFVLLISLLGFTFIVNAKEEWIFEELKLPEDIGITTLAFRQPFKDMSPTTPILALGNEYDCPIQSSSEMDKCNIYKIDYDGTITKYNGYYDNSNSDFPGYIHSKIALEGTKLRLTTEGSNILPSKSATLDAAAVVRYAHEDMNFNFLYCRSDVKEKIDICVVGVTDGGYGIIDSTGKFIVEPSTNYSKVFDDYEDRLPILKDNNNNLIIATANGKVEIIEKSFLNELSEKDFNINGLDILSHDNDKNYYIYRELPDIDLSPQVCYDYIFTKDKVLTSYNSSAGAFSTKVVFVNNNPYMVKTWQLNSLFTSDTLQDFNGNSLIADIDEASYGHELLSYNRSNKFYITDMKKNIVEKSLDENISGIMLLDESAYHNAYVYKEYKNVTALGDDWKPKYYILKKVTVEDEEEPISKPIETVKDISPKYMCKRVDGVFYDKNGDVVTKSEYEKLCPEVVPDTGYLIPTLTISLLLGGILILRKKNLISKI